MTKVKTDITDKQIMRLALWFGSLTGLVEGFGLWGLHEKQLLFGRFLHMGASIEGIWISIVFDILLFLFLGILFVLAGKLLRVLKSDWLVCSAFFFVMIFNWMNILLNVRAGILAIVTLSVGLTVQYYWWVTKKRWVFFNLVNKSLVPFVALSAIVFLGTHGIAWAQEKIAISKIPDSQPGMPNVLVIVIDTLRADHLSGYGYDRLTSRNIDKLAEGGVLFDNAYSTSSWTLPSHASILTGLYPSENNTGSSPLGDGYPTIGEQLQILGYEPVAFSANIGTFNRASGFGRGFVHFEDHFRSSGDMLINTVYGRMFEYYFLYKVLGYDGKVGRRLAADINDSVVRWFDRPREHPYFVFINYYDVHSPYTPPQPYRSMFSENPNPGGLISGYWGTDQLYIKLTPEQLQGEVDAYDGGIAYIDESIKQLLDTLKERGLLDNTIVVITSDHGEAFDEHGLRAHANSLYQEVIHVPLVVWWPGHLPEGLRVSQPVSIASIPSTIFEMIGHEDQTVFPGPSFVRLWDGSDIADYPLPMSEIDQLNWVPVQSLSAHGAMRSIIDPEWQYIVHEKFGEELFNLTEDPAEINSLAAAPEADTVLDFFRNYLEELLNTQR